MGVLKQAEGGVPVAALCREHGMSTASFYKWRSKYGGMDASMISEKKKCFGRGWERLKAVNATLIATDSCRINPTSKL